MSKVSKKRAAEKRRQQKFAKKQAKKALYESYANQGVNKKSKRFQKKGKKKLVSGIDHPLGPCGNPGCIKCFGINFEPFLRKGIPFRMPQWMYLRWKAA